MSKLDTLLKKRAVLDQEIERARLQQKRSERIAQLAAEAGLLEIADDELREAFLAIRAGKKPA